MTPDTLTSTPLPTERRELCKLELKTFQKTLTCCPICSLQNLSASCLCRLLSRTNPTSLHHTLANPPRIVHFIKRTPVVPWIHHPTVLRTPLLLLLVDGPVVVAGACGASTTPAFAVAAALRTWCSHPAFGLHVVEWGGVTLNSPFPESTEGGRFAGW